MPPALPSAPVKSAGGLPDDDEIRAATPRRGHAGGVTDPIIPAADAGFTLAPVLRFDRDGAEHHPGVAVPVLAALDRIATAQPQHHAGVRLYGVPDLTGLLTRNPFRGIAARLIGPAAHPVRAILFDKAPGTNWSLGWHQDRTIAVRRRVDAPGFGPWTVKQGILHVAPPFVVIDAMVTLRIHLDDVPADNAPLLIAPGSHRFGLVPEADVDVVVGRCGTAACLARRGDVWAYATPILHASAASRCTTHRRVLQVDYSAAALPGELDWLGV